MNRQTITFSANEQGLQKTGGITHYASDTISYIDAIFTLGENWNGFDEVRAIFKTPYTCNFAVLNSEGECTVPLEALVNKGSVRVNLVGSIHTEEAVVDRLTTHSVEALIIDEDVPVCGSESAPLEPSEYEQFVAKVANDANRAEAGASDAETSAQNAKTSEDNAKASEDNAKASETHAQTYAQNAHNSAISAETAKDEAEDARDEIRSMTATATTLVEGSQATASYSNGVLSLGIPRGDKGNKGDTGASAGFGTVTASVDDTIGTPSVEVTTSGSDTAKNFAFAFHNLKGQKGDKGDTGEVTMEMLEGLLPTDTASGAIASFSDGTNLFSAKSVLDSIEPIQDLHGYDKPWSGGNGKNKLKNLETTRTESGVTFTVNSDGSVVVNGTATALIVFTLNDVLGNYLENGASYYLNGSPTNSDTTKWKFRVYNYGDNIDEGAGVQFTFDSSIAQQKCDIVVYQGTTMNNVKIYPMIRLSSVSDATFAPYSNICPISGHTEVVTSRVGKNLYSDVFSEYAKPGAYYIKPLNLQAGQTVRCTVTLKGTSMTGCVVAIVGSGDSYPFGTMISFITISGQIQNQSSFTIGDTWTSPKLAIYCSGEAQFNQIFENYEIQLEIGRGTSYEPYNGTQYTTDLGRTVYGGALDVVSGVLTVDRVYVEYDGSSDEGWGYSNNRAIVALPNAPTGEYSRGFIANYLNPSVLITSTPAPWDAIINKTGILLVGTENIESLDDWNAYLSNNVLQLVYNLATPQTIQLTPQEVELLKGQNNLWCDCGEISVVYKADIQKWVEKKIN